MKKVYMWLCYAVFLALAACEQPAGTTGPEKPETPQPPPSPQAPQTPE